MLTLKSIIGRAVLAALITGIVGFAAIYIYLRIFEPADAADLRDWQTFSAMMGSLGVATLALVGGVIYGVARAKRLAGKPPD